MALRQEQHTIKGMQRDLSVSKFNPDYAFECKNIRITARDNNTLLTVTNERGNDVFPVLDSTGLSVGILGNLIGYNVINNYVVLFTSANYDYIYRLEYKETNFEAKLLYSGDLNFSTDNPIESIGVFENETIIKVYWVDGINQPRVVNILRDYTGASNTVFNFIPELKLNETVDVSVNKVASGQFPSGVVQYAFTYYNLNGQETNIFNQSPLVYAYRADRGGSPEETANNGFNITITNVDTSFDYIRIYSIVRTSINATPTVKVVADLLTSSTVRYTDVNATGYTIDPTVLLYIGGETIIPATMTQKDNTLFLGNLRLSRKLFSQSALDAVRGSVTFTTKNLTIPTSSTYYPYKNQLEYTSSQITTFKSRETYRFGVQFQHKTGRWSEVLYIGDNTNNNTPYMRSTNSYYSVDLIKATYTIPSSVVAEARDLGYVKARGVVVYPTSADRDVLCQGVVNSTVFNERDRVSDSPYAQSSWFFRPYVNENLNEISDSLDARYGSYAHYIDYDTIDRMTQGRSNEIGVDTYASSEVSVPGNSYYIDSSIVTMHSPDIEMADYVDYLSDSDLNFRIVGAVAMGSLLASREVLSDSASTNPDDLGFYNKVPTHSTVMLNNKPGGRMLISGVNWFGSPKKNQTTVVDKVYGWLVAPWQRNDSLLNDIMPEEGITTKAAMLKANKLSNLRVSSNTNYISVWQPNAGISTVKVFDSNEQTMVRLNTNSGDVSYYGNIDKVITPIEINTGRKLTIIGVVPTPTTGFDLGAMYEGKITSLTNDTEVEAKFKFSSGAVSMKYKSSKHAVFAFNKVGTSRVILPGNDTTNVLSYDTDVITSTLDAGYDCLWLGELYRNVPFNIKFGGNTPEALAANIWNIAGPAVALSSGSTSIEFNEGDTFFQRYDCLKTYPYTNEDQNSVVEILSFMCESYTNIDGRYDRNRGQSNNLAMSPTNFNLMNQVYSQQNNFFGYYYTDRSKLTPDSFLNSITWSKEKILGETTDTWTNVTLASTLDLDGDKGEVVSLNTYNNEIYCFQRKGLSNILFNSRVQIPTSDGVPIEITNGIKVSGKRYISNTIGCSNKWSIVESPSGIYFIDNETNSMYLYNSEGINSLSDRLGMRQWVSDNNVHKDWNPITYENFRGFYDKNNNDVYFVNKDWCLCYSELIGQFTSFMSYEKVPAMFNVSSEFFAFNNNKLWKQFSGEYNMFFGEFQPYYITVIANSEEPYDKIYNTIEFRADAYDDKGLLPDKTYDTLDVYNEYQHGTLELSNILGHPSPLKRKFRVWRANIPRANVDINGIKANNRDRIRNTWAYVKLSMNKENTYRTEFHDMIIHYFV